MDDDRQNEVKISAGAQGLEESNTNSPEYEEALKKWDKVYEGRINSLRESEHLTERDFAVRINARD